MEELEVADWCIEESQRPIGCSGGMVVVGVRGVTATALHNQEEDEASTSNVEATDVETNGGAILRE